MSKVKKSVEITFATVDTPAMSKVGETEKERLHLTPAEFRVQLKAHGSDVKDLVKMARRIGGLKSGQTIEVDGAKFGAKELNKLVSQHVKTLKQLSKNYTARGQKKKRVPKAGAARRTGEGFAKGSFLEAPLVNFLLGANFGSQNAAIHAAVDPLLEQNVLSRGVLTPLLTTYAFSNGLRFEQGGKKFYKVNPELNNALKPYIDEVERSDTGVNASGNARRKFDRNQFVYNRWQSVVNAGIRDKASLSADELSYLENDAIKEALRNAQAVVSSAESSAVAK